MTDDQPPTARPTAEPITAVVANRVRTFRERAGMSQEGLAAALDKHGVKWKRATVVNLEKRGAESRGAARTGRDTITVQELLALAVVLDVPPAALLVGPAASSVPIAVDAQPDPWDALLWLLGREPLKGAGRWRNEAGLLVDAAHQVLDALRALEAWENPAWRPGMPDAQRAELWARTREQHLQKLAEPLAVLAEQGVRVPLPDYVRRHAADLGVELPGVED